MVGYLLGNTVTENGHVARGICVTNAEGYLDSVTERTHIEKKPQPARASPRTTADLDRPARRHHRLHEPVGLHQELPGRGRGPLPGVSGQRAENEPLKGEYFLPSVVTQLIAEGKAQVKVLHSRDKWYGVTYKGG